MTAAEGERQVVVCSLHGEHYGLPITSVKEIIRYVPPSATAAASGSIQGMIRRYPCARLTAVTWTVSPAPSASVSCSLPRTVRGEVQDTIAPARST